MTSFPCSMQDLGYDWILLMIKCPKVEYCIGMMEPTYLSA